MTELAMTVLVGIAILIGIVGTLLPIVPGLLLCWGAVVVYGFIVGFDWVAIIAIVAATLLAATGVYLGVRIPQRHAAQSGLRPIDQVLAAVAAVAGAIFIPVIGLPIGFIGAIFVLRLLRTLSPTNAWESTMQSLKAMVKASGAQMACGFGIGAVWAAWVALENLR